MKSWAYNNGKREMNNIIESSTAPLRGWVRICEIEACVLFRYAERNKHDKTKLTVKTYANKTQAVKMIEKLKSEGADCWLRAKYPFVIECTEIGVREWYLKSFK